MSRITDALSDGEAKAVRLEIALLQMVLQYCEDTHDGKRIVFSRNMNAGQEALAILGFDEGAAVSELEDRLHFLEEDSGA